MDSLRILIGGCVIWILAGVAVAAPPLRDAAPLDGSSDGWRWLERPLPAGTGELRGVWASDAEHAWAVGSDGTLIAGGAGREWQAQASGTRAVLEGVWGSGTKEVFVVGAGGTILHTVD